MNLRSLLWQLAPMVLFVLSVDTESPADPKCLVLVPRVVVLNVVAFFVFLSHRDQRENKCGYLHVPLRRFGQRFCSADATLTSFVAERGGIDVQKPFGHEFDAVCDFFSSRQGHTW